MTDVKQTVDDILVNQSRPQEEPEIKEEEKENEIIPESNEEKVDYGVDDNKNKTDKKKEPEEKKEINEEQDDFGNKIDKSKELEVPKSKLYTEEEVNAMMRDRLKRGEYAKQIEPETQNNNEGNENWEEQLEGFVKQTITKMTQKEKEEHIRQQDIQFQKEFEGKFLKGMSRYGDFKDVVADKPITDTMMMATRSMKDPAAFLYAAAKAHPKELERIAKITDPYYQVAEMGRLEERMRKVRSNSTSAPRPLDATSGGDVENRQNHRGSVDDLIRQDAKRKLSRR